MRKAFITLTILFSFSLCAQNITWQNVNLNVPFENTNKQLLLDRVAQKTTRCVEFKNIDTKNHL